jgi:cytochrome b subunit of formate dehydrogenase
VVLGENTERGCRVFSLTNGGNNLNKNEETMANQLNELDYSSDFELAKRYIDFSAELLRISLLVITGIGVIIIKPEHGITISIWQLIAAVFFVISICGAIAHRYYATDCLSCRIAYLRKEKETEKIKEKEKLRLCLKNAKNCLIITEVFFALGIIASIIIFFIIV